MKKFSLFPEIEPFHSELLEVSGIHKIYLEQSGNPKGRPKSGFALNEYITDLANVELEDKKTMLEAVVAKVYEEALDGNMTAINFLADRILGKPSQSIGIKDVSDEPIKVFDIDGLED